MRVVLFEKFWPRRSPTARVRSAGWQKVSADLSDAAGGPEPPPPRRLSKGLVLTSLLGLAENPPLRTPAECSGRARGASPYSGVRPLRAQSRRDASYPLLRASPRRRIEGISEGLGSGPSRDVMTSHLRGLSQGAFKLKTWVARGRQLRCWARRCAFATTRREEAAR